MPELKASKEVRQQIEESLKISEAEKVMVTANLLAVGIAKAAILTITSHKYGRMAKRSARHAVTVETRSRTGGPSLR